MSVGLVYDPMYLEHDTGQHPENAGRLACVMKSLEEARVVERTVSLPLQPATTAELARVHSESYIAHVQALARIGGGWIDGDTVVSPASYDVALLAAGGLISSVDAVLTGQVESSFALVRPPGHHAAPCQGAGFCLFNNIAIAAKHAIETHKLKRVLIVDFDVHHGNGTQDAFYYDPQVLYFSTHQYPFYPGTGRIDEVGAGVGEGTTVNVPLPAWCGDEEYLQAFEEILAPTARRFQPQFIMVSAGYDAHWGERLALMQVTVAGYARMVQTLKSIADEHCSGRLVFALEGGYFYEALASSVGATIDVISGKTDIVDPLGGPPAARKAPPIDGILNMVRHIHGLG